jgi:hypothetical protein
MRADVREHNPDAFDQPEGRGGDEPVADAQQSERTEHGEPGRVPAPPPVLSPMRTMAEHLWASNESSDCSTYGLES